MKVEEYMYQEVANQALNYHSIEEQEFMMSQQVHMNDPKFQQAMMQVQMGLDEDDKDWQPSVTRDKAKEIFKFVEEMKFETMEKMAKSMAAGGQMDQMEATVKMLVEHAKVGDQLFTKF